MTGRRAPSPRRLGLLLRALLAVAVVRLLLSLRLGGALRDRLARAPVRDEPSPAEQREVAWSVAAAARLVPGATCLTQAMAGQALLSRRGKASTVRITLPAEAPGGALKPHAWLLASSTILLGGTTQELAAHRPITEFRAGARR